MGSHQPIRKAVVPEIPDKLYFRIGDVARLCEVPAYVLRFWETEFPQLKPNKGGTGQRLYRRKDVELALRIKSLLYDQGYTIPGARQVFKNEAVTKPAHAEPVASTFGEANGAASAAPLALRQQVRLRELREDLAALLKTLSVPPSTSFQVKTTGAVLRPRLVLEPRSVQGWRQASSTILPQGQPQRDLFADDSRDDAEWPEPPTAS